MIDDIFIKYLPTLDLHGLDRDSARVALEDFISDSYKLKEKRVVVIHGVGLAILKNEVHNSLSKNKYVLGFRLQSFNPGCTIVALKEEENK